MFMRFYAHCCTASAVDLLAVSNAKDEHDQAVVLDLADEPVISHTVFPKLPEPGALQGLSNAASIAQLGYSFMEELQDAPGVLGVELAQFPVRSRGNLNLPCHDVS